jgi:hypothetical protein
VEAAPAGSPSESSGVPESEPSESQENHSEESASPETQAPPPRKRYRVKVDGQEEEVDEDELVKSYSHHKASSIKMQQAQELRKHAERVQADYTNFLNTIQKDPWKIFDALKMDPTEAAEKLLLDKLRIQQMTPEQRALYEKEQSLTAKERELEEYKRKQAEEAENLAKQQQEELTYKAVKELDGEIGDVLKATGLKPTRRTVSRIAEIMLAHLDSGDGERLGADKAFGIFKGEMQTEISEYLAGLTPEQLLQTLPKPVLDAIRKADLDRVRATDPLKHGTRGQASSTHTARNAKRMSTDSLFANLEKRLK